jgi:subtilisin family serine protease
LEQTAKIVKTFKSPAFTGFSVESAEDNVDTLQAIQEVTQAWPVKRIKLSPMNITAKYTDGLTPPDYNIHKYTGVDQLHAAGIFGKGAVVAVVDTGIDYRHPALGAGFGPGNKIAGGYDFIGDGEWPYAPKEPDQDIMDNIGHGTHVTGIIAGSNEYFKGVAPEATILGYKVFGVYDYTDDDTLMEAFLKAYEDGADIITASIGGLGGFSGGPWALVADKLADLGVVVTIAAGNEGDFGPFYGSDGAMGKNVLGVASMDPGTRPALPFTATFNLNGASNTTTLAYLPGYNVWDVPSMPVRPVSLDSSSVTDACSPLPPTTGDLSGVISLVRRGACTYREQQLNLEQFGAQYVLVYDNELPFDYPFPGWDTSSNLAITEATAGEAMINTIAAGGNVTATFKPIVDRFLGVHFSGGGIPSQFTSWGGSYELEVKPDVAAPGGNILSTYPGGNTWAELSGTSMACPYVAGVAALYIGKYGGRKTNGPGVSKIIRDRIVSSAGAIPWQILKPVENNPIDYGQWAPVPQVGTGLINAARVLNSSTQLKFEKIALNDTAHFNRYHKVDIANTGKEPVTYKFSLQPYGAFDAQSPIYHTYLKSYLEMEGTAFTLVPKVSFPSGTFTVKPGETRTAQFSFSPVDAASEGQLPVYSGKILIEGNNGDALGVPYMGVAADVKKTLRRNLWASTPYCFCGVGRDDIQYYHTFGFKLGWYEQDFPKIQADLHWGTKELRWDIFEADWKEKDWQYPPVVGEKGYVGSVAFWEGSGGWGFDGDNQDPEPTINFPVLDLPRAESLRMREYAFWWFGKLANGSYIAPGNYT